MKSIKKHPFPLLPRWLAQKRKEKQFRQKLSEYQELYLTDVIIENELLGTCVFEKDANRNTLRLKQNAVSLPFGRDNTPELHIHIDEKDLAEAFQGLSDVYHNQERFLKEFYAGIKGFCDEWEETDSAGNPVSLEMIEANCSVSDITVSRSWQGILTVSLSGGAADDTGRDLLGCHAVIAEINYKTSEIEYGLEG